MRPVKISVKELDYDRVAALPRPAHQLPKRPNMFWRTLIRLLTIVGMAGTGFQIEKERMELIGKDEPCLILMNHSCFLDMQIAYRAFYPRPFNIVATSDSFVGFGGLMGWLMRQIGCIPTRKFVTDLRLVQDMTYALKTLKNSVLLYPEASYSFDGTATPLPRKMGVLLKKFDVPVVMIETFGAFSRNPLYNELQVRKSVPVSAKVRCLYTREEIQKLSVQELSGGLDEAFGFDHFKWQKEQKLEINDSFRADGLSRILYKCAHCGAEGQMEGRGTGLTCGCCGKRYELTPLGELRAAEGETEFTHIPDWYAWERDQVRQEILEGSYKLDANVKIAMLVDYKNIYMVGEGHLTHDRNGFVLTGCDGRLHYTQKPQACYGLYADYYWYEIADVICIGDNDKLFYCFPQGCGDVVAKTRLAVEEMYKLYKTRKLKAEPEAAAEV
ncbi:MAG: 1-acyl-sn-glycerol-3-phosphate acyltransferase [Oscillospiraceae bacterium]|nr:1-acyl-sn-glycerol-3-phosphate acyltransferase [Oscillospiraceae bacterium]